MPPPRNRGQSTAQREETARRRAAALEVFQRGFRGEAAAVEMRRLGHQCDRFTWNRLCQKAIVDIWRPAAEDVRDAEIIRLERAYQRSERSLNRLERVCRVYASAAVKDAEDGSRVVGDIDAANLLVKAEQALAKANDQHIHNSESRRKLLGVDAPTKVDATIKSGDATPARARSIMQEIFGGNVGPVATVDGAEVGASDPGGATPGTTTH